MGLGSDGVPEEKVVAAFNIEPPEPIWGHVLPRSDFAFTSEVICVHRWLDKKNSMNRLPITKTPKAYVGGKFIRSESGRVAALRDTSGGFLCNVPVCSRKDLRNAVEAAAKAGGGWAARTAYNRGQILYRLAEMMEARAAELADAVAITGATTPEAAAAEVAATIDRLVYYAGWTDKYEQVLGNTNPVSGPFFNFTVTEPVGVIGVIAPSAPSLLGLVTQVAPIMASGNAVVALASESNPYPAILLGEMLATSDLPGGVVNLLTGAVAELLETFASHEHIRGLDLAVNVGQATKAGQLAAASIKRLKVRAETNPAEWGAKEAQSLYAIQDFIEFKTTWHPIGA
jgi:acyl-CoA reductase-like NAD-dependent aldehyde dehydrogenase